MSVRPRGPAVPLLALAAALSAGAAQADFSLTILHINDFHSRIEPISRFDNTCAAADDAEGKCFGGVARLKTALEARRAALGNTPVLTLDAGDQFQGSLFYSTYKGAAEAEFMAQMGFDAMAVGNHEFDDGPEVLAAFIDAVPFPLLSTNTNVASEPLLANRVVPHVIVERGGERIGIVSALTPSTAEIASPGPNVSFGDEIAALQAAVDDLTAQGVRHIIALTHVGLPRDLEIAASVRGVDAIVGGHSHSLLSNTAERAEGPYPMMVANPDGVMVPVVTAYAYGKYLGELTLRFDGEGRVVEAAGEPTLIDASFAPDPAMAERVAALAGPIEDLKRVVVGETLEPIDGARENCRARECSMGTLVATAMLERVRPLGAQIAIQNGGGLRASIEAGPVTKGDVLTVLPFQNTLATFDLTGADIIAALENGLSEVSEGAGRFPQVAGMRFVWNPAAEAGSRVVRAEVETAGGWAPLEAEAVYAVVTNNFMRRGGDGYAVFSDRGLNAYDFGPNLEDVVAEYLTVNNPYSPTLPGLITEGTD
jgi:5'-nucleotidase